MKPKTILREANLFSDLYIVQYDYDISWELHNETKKIGSLLCKKASAKINGKSIFVWYTEEINISEGPLYFRGLNGLIVLLEEEMFSIAFESIQKLKKIKILPIESQDAITSKEFIKIREEKLQNIGKKF